MPNETPKIPASHQVDGVKLQFDLMKFIATVSIGTMGVLVSMKQTNVNAVVYRGIILLILSISLFHSIVGMNYLANHLKKGSLDDTKDSPLWLNANWYFNHVTITLVAGAVAAGISLLIFP